MARASKTTTTTRRSAAPAPTPAAVPKPADSRDDLTVADLARGVLSREVRPRVSDIRRLAEAVLAAPGAKPGKGKKGKAGGKKAKGKKALAKIPGQKAKK